MERALLWWPVMPYAEEQINIHSCFQTMNSEIVSGLTQTSIRCKPLRYTVVTDILQPSMERVMDSNFWTSKDFKEYPQPKVKKRRASSNPSADMGNLTADNGFWQSSESTQSDGHQILLFKSVVHCVHTGLGFIMFWTWFSDICEATYLALKKEMNWSH